MNAFTGSERRGILPTTPRRVARHDLHRQRGHLLDVLIPLLIIGILAAIAIPNLLTAIQRAKEKRTVARMRAIAAAIETCRARTGHYPHSHQLERDLVPTYMQSLPKDGWGDDFRFESWTGTGGRESYAIASGGKGGDFEKQSVRDYAQVEATTSFSADIVLKNGRFLMAPEEVSPPPVAGCVVILLAIASVVVLVAAAKLVKASFSAAPAQRPASTKTAAAPVRKTAGGPVPGRQISVWECGGIVLIEIAGQFVLETAELLLLVRDLLEANRKDILIDLSAVKEIRGLFYAGVRDTIGEAHQRNVRLTILGLEPQPRQVLDATGLAAFVDIHPTIEAAVATRNLHGLDFHLTRWLGSRLTVILREDERFAADPIVEIAFHGTYPPGSEGNDFASEMVEAVRSAVGGRRVAAAIFDMTDLHYACGDAIAGIATPLLERRRPAAIVARGDTAQSLKPLVGPGSLLGVAGIRLFTSRDAALDALRKALAERSRVADSNL